MTLLSIVNIFIFYTISLILRKLLPQNTHKFLLILLSIVIGIAGAVSAVILAQQVYGIDSNPTNREVSLESALRASISAALILPFISYFYALKTTSPINPSSKVIDITNAPKNAQSGDSHGNSNYRTNEFREIKLKKIVLGMGLIAILIMTIIPPWSYTFTYQSVNSQESAGYRFIGTPPPPKDPGAVFGVKIDIARLSVQILAALVLTGLGLLVVTNSRK